ncbi:hypothetical protein PENSPDRAFT_688846 [Peniophora sp. CONT]|nr:hypothetical protein PENSPDRAFT_688846 [Peniophora sp. CONT]
MPQLDTIPDTYEGDDYFSDTAKPIEGENDRLRREIRSLRQRNDALQQQIRDVAQALPSVIVDEDPRFIAQAQRIRKLEEELSRYRQDIGTAEQDHTSEPGEDERMGEAVQRSRSSSSASESEASLVVERLAAHLNPDPAEPFVPVEPMRVCENHRGPKIKAFRKWVTPQRLWVVDDNSICRRNWNTGRAIVHVPTQIPTAEGEVQRYKVDTAPFVVGDTRELVNWRFGKWEYLGTYKIMSIDTLCIQDASMIRRPNTFNIAKTIAHFAVPKAQSAQLLSMLEEGTSNVHAIALTRIGSNEELIEYGRTDPWDLKKETLKKTENVRRLIVSEGIGESPRRRKLGKGKVVKKEES